MVTIVINWVISGRKALDTAVETVKLPDFQSAKIHLLTGSW